MSVTQSAGRINRQPDLRVTAMLKLYAAPKIKGTMINRFAFLQATAMPKANAARLSSIKIQASVGMEPSHLFQKGKRLTYALKPSI